MRGRYGALSILALGAGFVGGIAVERFHFAAPSDAMDDGEKILYWVAPMDANFRKDGPGKSPMGMDLVPVYEGDEPSGEPGEVALSAREVNAIGVRTAVARIETVAPIIETVGFVTYDEDATSHIHARIAGWVEGLRVRAVGDPVRAGEALFEVYGPRQERDTMDRIGAPAEHLRIRAPQSGVVTALAASEGMYLEPGTRAMSITDLSTVWVIADVFERDIGRLSEGMTAEARFESLPREIYRGEIDYIYPELDPKTRTLAVRMRFDNADGKLRPNMFGRIRLSAMETRESVTVPSESVIRTGRAERVILATGDGTFRPRLVTTGLRDGFGTDGRTEIVQGLESGAQVVASAQFLIDSESALSAGMTRMAPTEAAPASGKGVLLAVDEARNSVTIKHSAIPALDWPAMRGTFALRGGVRLERVAVGDAVRFSLVRGADGLLALSRIGGDDGVDATGMAVVHAITPDGTLSLSHDPIPDLSWPAMTMDLQAQGIDLASIPLDSPVEIDLSEGEGGLYTVIGVRAAKGMDSDMMDTTDKPMMEKETPASSAGEPERMDVSGTVNSVDKAARKASVTHGPIAAIGMPGMTMEFTLGPDVDPATLPIGEEIDLSLTMDPATYEMSLVGFEAPEPPMRVSGTINTVDAMKGTANVTHGPIREIGMPGMTMEFTLGSDIDPAALPVGEEIDLSLTMDPETFEMSVVGFDAPEPPMRVSGTINTVDTTKGTANVTHGPMQEIGMPGMTMEFALADKLPAESLPVGKETTLLISMDPATFEMTLEGVAR